MIEVIIEALRIAAILILSEVRVGNALVVGTNFYVVCAICGIAACVVGALYPEAHAIISV